MRRREKAGRKAGKAQRRKALTRRNAPKAARRRNSSAGRETEIARLTRELDEAREQLAATSEVLKVISSSPGDMKPVFEAMLANALRICDAKFGHILLYDGERFHATHLHDVPAAYREYWEQHAPLRPGPKTGL